MREALRLPPALFRPLAAFWFRKGPCFGLTYPPEHGCCWETFCILAYSGLVVEIPT